MSDEITLVCSQTDYPDIILRVRSQQGRIYYPHRHPRINVVPEVAQWLDENTPGAKVIEGNNDVFSQVSPTDLRIVFKNAADAIAFKLRWL